MLAMTMQATRIPGTRMRSPTFGLTRVPASTATTVTLTEPAVATILAVVIVGERLTVTGWTGLAIIAAALVILALTPTNSGTALRVPAKLRRIAAPNTRTAELPNPTPSAQVEA